MSKKDCAISVFKEGYNCSQAILSTYGEQFGLHGEIALKVSAAFGGGMGCMGETCGAVTGAFMIIGLKCGRTKVEDKEAKERTYESVREFVNQFKSRNGSTICRELLGCDISTSEGMKYAEDKKLFAYLCPKFVLDAAEIIEQII